MKRLENKKKYKQHVLIVLLCFCFVGSYYYFIKAAATPVVQFTDTVNVVLSGTSAGDLQIATSSESVGVDISGVNLDVTDITDGSTFILKTPTHTNALSLTPSGDVLDLSFDSSNLSSGSITQWTLMSSSSMNVSHIVGAALPSTSYIVKVDGANYNSYTSDGSSQVSFAYTGGSGTKVFTIEAGSISSDSTSSTGGGGLPPEFTNPPAPPGPTTENPEGELNIIVEPEEEIVVDEEGGIITVEETIERVITLKLFAGDNVERMVVSEDPLFKDAGQELFKETKEWTLSEGDGKKTIYVKYYTKYGIPSDIISIDIILLPKDAVRQIDKEIPEITETQETATTTTTTTIATTTQEIIKPPIVKPVPEKEIRETRKVVGGENIYKGIAGTVFAEIAEMICILIENTVIHAKDYVIKIFDHISNWIYMAMPDSLMNWLFCPGYNNCSNGFINNENNFNQPKSIEHTQIYNGVAKTQYAVLAERITYKVNNGTNNTKIFIVQWLDNLLKGTYNLLPNFISNGYENVVNWVKEELLKLFRG